MGARATTKTRARDNASKITGLLEAGEGYADLYRTAIAGPSGQRSDILVGRVRFRQFGHDEFTIVDMADGGTAGFARMVHHDQGGRCWFITAEAWDGTLSGLGWASSLSIGCDVLINGEFAALGRHDSRRISSGWFAKVGSRA
jgi:hypothetical protein